jgi:hypothetical protein
LVATGMKDKKKIPILIQTGVMIEKNLVSMINS